MDTSCWESTPAVKSWLTSPAINMTADQAYGYFVRRVAGFAIAQHHRPVQWSEVYDHFGNTLPKETIIHSEYIRTYRQSYHCTEQSVV